jgi:hypothetical protein
MKQAKKFAAINFNNSIDMLVLPMNRAALGYIAEKSEYTTFDSSSTRLALFNTDGEDSKWNALRRFSKPVSRFSTIYSAIIEMADNDNTYIRMNDCEMQISPRLWDYLLHKTNLKWIEENDKLYMIADESIIPEGLVESYVNKNKLVEKDNIDKIYGDDSILRYHYSEYHPEISKQFTRYMDKSQDAVNFGFEAEKVDTKYVNEGIALKLSHDTGFKKELDGSLGSDGFELISPVLPLFNQGIIDECIEPVKNMLNAATNNSCGGHFNISKNGTHSMDLLKKIKGSLPLLYIMYEKRLSNRYCEVKPFSTYLRRPNKYSACYLKSKDIVEIRLFPAIKNNRILQNRIELMRMIMSELYGLSAMKVLLKLADPSSNLHNFVLNILDGDIQKMKEKIVTFRYYSEKYGCGKISLPTLKKVNKMMNAEIFYIPEN